MRPACGLVGLLSIAIAGLSSKRFERTGKTWLTCHGLEAPGRDATSSRAMSNSPLPPRRIDSRVTHCAARNAMYCRPSAPIAGAGSPELQRLRPPYGVASGPSPTVQVAPASDEL